MPSTPVDQALAAALDHHRAGRLREAEGLYRQILAANPRHPDALHLLGMLAMQTGHAAAAVDLVSQAVAVAPHLVDYHNSLGNALGDSGRFDEAVAAYDRALALNPRHPIITNNRANALRKLNRLDESLAGYQRAIALDSSLAPAHNGLATVLLEQRQFEPAIAAARRATQLDPHFAEAWNSLGIALRGAGQLALAAQTLGQAAQLNPASAPLHLNLGLALEESGRFDDALAAYDRAIALSPSSPSAHNNRGNVLRRLMRIDESADAYRQAIRLQPDFAEYHGNLGIALADQGRLPESIAAQEKALALKPDWAEGHHNLAMALLLAGDLPRGFAEFEWRWRCPAFPSPRRNFPNPMWHGQPLEGRTLLLHAEQGLGDTIQFIRYAKKIAALGASVVVACQPELVDLLKRAQGVDRIVGGETLPAFDFHLPMMSLPFVFKTRLDSIPCPLAYLHADAQTSARWKIRVRDGNPRLRVGLAWAGRPAHAEDARRSIALRQLAPLAQVANVEFHSLQKGPALHAARSDSGGIALIDHDPLLTDFHQTAGLVENLDLILSVDTAVAHLAAAMGKPTWILLAARPDWRWLLDREDSPWYPSARLFRQRRLGEWTECIQRVAAALAAWVAGRKEPA